MPDSDDDQTAPVRPTKKELTRRRAGIKGWLTRGQKQLDTFIQNKEVVKVRLEMKTFESRMADLQAVQSSIEELIDNDPALIIEINQSAPFIELCTDFLAKAVDFLEKSEASSTDKKKSESAAQKFLKPKLEIKKFGGELLEWLPFIQSYDNSVGNVDDVPGSIKLQILNENLLDEAASTIKFYSIVNENYAPAYAALNEKYGDKDRLIEAYIEQLLELKDKGTSLTLRHIYDQLLCTVRTLETLEVERSQYAVLLVPMLRTIFSRPIKVKWAKYERKYRQDHKSASHTAQAAGNPVPDRTNRLSLFLEFLKEEVEIQETANAGEENVSNKDSKKQKDAKPDHSDASNKQDVRSQPTASFLYQPNQQRQQNQQNRQQRSQTQQWTPPYRPSQPTRSNLHTVQLPPCPFCTNGKHHPAYCSHANSYSPSQIQSLINRDKRCISCLGYHPSQPCKSERPCPLCNYRHHPLLCNQRAKLFSSQTAQFQPSHQSHLVAPIQPNDMFVQPNQQTTNTHPNMVVLPNQQPNLPNVVAPIQQQNLQIQPQPNMVVAPIQQPQHFAQPPPPVPAYNQGQGQNTTPISLVAPNPPEIVATCSQPQEQTLLPTATICVFDQNSTENFVRLLMDCGSQRSYITRALAHHLQAKVLRKEIVRHSVFGGHTTDSGMCEVVEIRLKARHSSCQVGIELLVVECISNSKFPVIKSQHITKYAHLQNVILADDEQYADMNLSILIGMDYFWHIVTTDVKKGLPTDPVGIGSVFGYLVSGGTPTALETNTTLLSFITKTTTKKSTTKTTTEKLLKQFFEIESLGITADELCSNDDFALQSFEENVEFDGERYNNGLVWRPDHPELLSNFKSVENRQAKSDAKTDANPEISKIYDESLQEFVDCDYIEETTGEKPPIGKERYMPHRPQIKTTSSTYKARPVYDAGAQDETGNSLNACLLPGPSLIPDLLKTKVRWRTWLIAIVGDIRRAFLQMGIKLSDRDVLRFLIRGTVYRFKRVPFGVTCSPFLLNATIRYHLERHKQYAKSPEELALLTELAQCFYVDDYVSGADSVENGLFKAQSATGIMKKGGFDLRSWITSSHELSDKIKNSGCSMSQDAKTRILGTEWNSVTDKISVRSVEWPEEQYTVRNVAKNVPKAYDILGIVSPIIVRAKIVLSKILRGKQDWDEVILDPILIQEINIVKSQYQKLHEISIPRNYFNRLADGPCFLHLFCDASSEAICACLYIVNGTASSLVVAKTKVTPADITEIPRLEILACLVGAKLISTIQPELDHYDIQSGYCWTDSTTALAWIKYNREDEKRPVWIKRRISNIQTLTTNLSWKYVPTKSNPADLGTRPNCSVEELKTNELWWNGPDFITKKQESWPDSPIPMPVNLAEIENSICPEPEPTPVLKTKTKNTIQPFDSKRYGRRVKILRIAAYMLRFVYRKAKRLPVGDDILVTKPGRIGDETLYTKTAKKIPVPSAEEMERAELYWTKIVQKEHFQRELNELSKDGKISTRNPLYSLRPTLDENGILRSVGRAHRIQDKNPILLPNSSHYTDLVIFEIHERCFHVGVSQTLSEIQRRYFIPRGRQAVKRVLNDCLVCQKHKVKPYQQTPAPLPDFRLNEEYAFASCGIDHTGPLYIKGGVKVWVLLITCASTRALHLEPTHDAGAESVVNMIRITRARRCVDGHMKSMLSDNAKAFKKAKKILRELKWDFIPAYTPWWGGFWERFNRSVKAALRKTLGRASVTFDELRVILAEIESVINRRPLTYVSDARDDPQSICPADFLLTPGPAPLTNNASPILELNNRHQHRLETLRKVWLRWRHEYIQEIHRWRLKELGYQIPKVGDIVMVTPPKAISGKLSNRALFPLGRITKINIGKDGYCRSAYVKLGDREVRRATRHLYPLECTPVPDVTKTTDDVNKT